LSRFTHSSFVRWAAALVAVAATVSVSTPQAQGSASAVGTVDWAGSWIGRDTPVVHPEHGQQNPAPLLRREFDLSAGVVSARLSIVGLGYYVAWINGKRVGDQVLDPPPSQYNKTAFSRSFDVTPLLSEGSNAIGVELGRSYFASPAPQQATDLGEAMFGMAKAQWWQEPRLLAQLDITLQNGTTQRIVTDGSWKIADGPTRDALYYGEIHDARKAIPGWTEPSYDDASWESAPEQPAPTEKVVPAGMPPVKVTSTLAPVKVLHPQPGVAVYDFGRHTAGWARISTQGAAGTTITLRYGEQLDADGLVAAPGLGTHVDSYTLSGNGTEVWEPSFTRHGFRYVQVESAPTAPSSFSIQARVAHTALTSAGSFSSSSQLLNTIQRNQQDSLLANMWGIPTDTPWRDRQGWTADAYLYLDSAASNFDVEDLYVQWLRSFREAQRVDGTLPVVAPYGGGGAVEAFANDPSWSGALILTAWDLYQHYGDRSVLDDNYAAMSRWMNLMELAIAGTGNLYQGWSFGDWASPGSEANGSASLGPPEGSELTANADLYHEARLLARIARNLGRTTDALRYDALAERIKTAFNAKFFDPQASIYRTPQKDVGYRQTSNLVALAYGLVPGGREPAVFDNLVDDIVGRGTDLNTGAIGTKLLLPVLTEHGRADLAYQLATQTDYPSWGHWVQQGATTSWETWSITGTGQSMNHAFLGTIDDWLYQHLVGIQAAAPGYEQVLIAPQLPHGLGNASGQVTTPHGTVSSSWTRSAKGTVTLTIVAPDTTTKVRVPAPPSRVKADSGSTLVAADDSSATYLVTPGRHVFKVS
jgi:alpha-L-rhamnosidase